MVATETTPILFGAAQPGRPGVTQQHAVQELEASIGRQLGVVRVYRSWDSPWPDAFTSWLKASGRTMFLSVRATRVDGTAVSWRAIAEAQPGDTLHTQLVTWADRIKSYGAPMYLAFHHEPDTTVSHRSGTAADFVAAWRAWVTVLRDRGVINVEHSWTIALPNLSVPTDDARYAPSYYPGDSWVDNIAVDAYNMYCLRKDGRYHKPWRSLQELLSPFMAFVREHPQEGLIVAEWGSPEDPAVVGRKAEWISAARLLFQLPDYARFEAVSYWNRKSLNFAGCDFAVSTSASALAAFSEMANDAYYSRTSLSAAAP
jgi:hypothetical protein